MNRPPAFQFYAKDWLSSKKIVTMTLEEEGAYIHLLAHCWDSPDCTLPDDDTELAQLSRMGERWFNGGSTTLRKCFVPHPRNPGRLTNLRLLEEFRKYTRWIQKSREGGIRSGEIRRKQVNGGSRVVEPKANPSSSSSSSVLKKKNTPAGRSDLNGCQAGFDLFWQAYPKKRGKGQAEKVWAKLKPDEVLLDTMLGKIEQAKHAPDWAKDDGKFIPHPATWLNGKGWEDEFPMRKERLPL